MFQKSISETFYALKGVVTYLADVLIYANSEEELRKRENKVLQKAKQRGFKFYKNKREFNEREINFLTHKFSGISYEIDPDKLNPLKKRHEKLTTMFAFLKLYN